MTIPLTTELLADLRKKAERAAEEFQKWAGEAPDWNDGRCHPRNVLALLDRIEALEKDRAELQRIRLADQQRRAAMGGGL